MSKFVPVFKITNPIAAALTQIERARGFLEAAKLSEEWIGRMRDRALVLEAHHTTHIEGTHLTLEQAELILSGQPAPGADPDDAQELLNYRKAFSLVADYLDSGDPVTEGLVRGIHKCLVDGVRGGSAAPGQYREVQNHVVNSIAGDIIYTPPQAPDVPAMMADLVEWIQNEQESHPVLVAGIAQFQLVHIHPFLDGNGRTARLLSTLCLYRTGYDFKRLFTISEYYDRNRPGYYSAIQGVRENDMNMTQWLEYFAEGLATQMREVRDRGERVIRLDMMVRSRELSERQREALEYVLEHGTLVIRDFEALRPDVSRRSLERDLKFLVEKKLLTREGAADRVLYRLVENGE